MPAANCNLCCTARPSFPRCATALAMLQAAPAPPSADSPPLPFQIGSSDAGWTLGYMLNLTNMIPAEEPAVPPLSHGSYVGLMVLCSLVLVSVLLFAWLLFHKPKCLQKGIV